MTEETFSAKVKLEAAEAVSARRHCQLAELAGILAMTSECSLEKGIYFIHENSAVAKKVFTLIKKTYKIAPEASVVLGRGARKRRMYQLKVTAPEAVKEILMGIKHPSLAGKPEGCVDEILLQKNCCKRAFIRGCFLAAGSVTDPEKSYHFEIICPNEAKAIQLSSVISSFWDEEDSIYIKYTLRKRPDGRKVGVVYVKDGDRIADILNICECYKALMQMENVRVKKEIANSLNRRQNCEMANMVKTISAAQEQKNDIQYIEDMMGIDRLPQELREIARLRLADTEMSLKELGEALDPPVGKSCVNHRLRKIKKIAEEIKAGEYSV